VAKFCVYKLYLSNSAMVGNTAWQLHSLLCMQCNVCTLDMNQCFTKSSMSHIKCKTCLTNDIFSVALTVTYNCCLRTCCCRWILFFYTSDRSKHFYILPICRLFMLAVKTYQVIFLHIRFFSDKSLIKSFSISILSFTVSLVFHPMVKYWFKN